MATKYLDKDGLLYLWSKIKALVASSQVTVDDTLSTTSTNPVQNKIIKGALDGKVDTVSGKGLSTNDYTTTEKNKLSGIASGAQVNVIESLTVNGVSATVTNKAASVTIPTITVDDTLSTTSTNPVQNKIIKGALDGKVDTVSGKGLSTNDYTTTEKNKLSGIASGAQVNVIESLTVNGVAATITSKAASVTIPTGTIDSISVNGTAQTIDENKNVNITVPTNNNQLTNGAGYQTSSQVNSAIDAKISSTYKAKGSVAFASLPALNASNSGNVYNVTDAFTTTSDFVEGAGNKYPAGTNVVIINTTGSTYKYDVLAGFVDLSGYVQASDLVAITNAEIDTIVAS